MKTHFYKQTFLLLTLVAYSLIFTSCENDETITTEITNEQNIQKSIITDVSLSEIPSIEKYVNNNLSRDYKVSLNVAQINNSREPDVEIEIKTDQIKQSTNTDNISNYSFSAKYTDHNHELNIINFVVSEKYDQSLYSYIIIYKPEPVWFESKNEVLVMDDFSGEILFFNYDGSYVGTSILQNGIFISSTTRTPCDGDGNNNGGSSGGGGNGGTGGTTGGSTGGGSTGGGGGGGGTTGGSASCTCGPEHSWGDPECSCDEFEIIVIVLSLTNPEILDLLQRGPCDGDVQGDPCERSSSNPCDNEVIGVEIANILFNNESWEDYPCQKDIVQEAYNVCSPITNLFQDIFEGNTSADVEFFADPNYINYAVTEGTFAPERIPITFGLNSLEGSDILMTTVAIHEIFHANLYYIFKVNSEDSDPSNDFNIPQNSNPTYAELVEAFASLETGSSSSTIQHNFIANYKNQIAQGVYNWAVTQGGYSESNNLLEDLKKLAWVGLKDTDLWNQSL
ncbi:hypothetical protein [Patiriisocius marinus]|uniref:hypothetical protein n=1 Tax=Patiriisocius marinus TaxID=1397112 RepID=UPI00232D57CD|nr:hypothetical protein [Patiriisocius marinus]